LKSKRIKATFIAVMLVGAALVLAACGGGTSATAGGGAPGDDGGEPTTIRYQEFAAQINVAEIAEKLGYLGDLHLQSVGQVLGGPESIQGLATGQTDVAGGAFYTAIIKAIVAGAPVKAVVGMLGSNAKSFQALDVLEDGSIKSAKDLVGKKIGVNTLGANFEAWVKLWLKKEGLTPDEIGSVSFVVIPPVNAEEALRHGQLDAVVLSGPLRELAESKGGVEVLAKDVEVLGNYTGNAALVSDSFMEQHPKASAQLIGGMAKAVHYLQTTPAPQVIKLADEVAAEHGRTEDVESLKFWKSSGVVNEGGYFDPKEVSIWIKFLEEEGELKPGEIKPEEVFTNQFNPYAKGK
jgi:ABC-type nitrate/sulfonate/bicarbonate transport system substrate-binding protein